MVYRPSLLVEAPMALPTTLTCAVAIGSRVVASVTWPVIVACCSCAPATPLASIPNDAVNTTARIRLRVPMGTSWRERAAAACASADGESHRREDFQETARMAAQVTA